MENNNMRKIRIEKVTLNIGVGQPGDKLEKAMKLLKNITDRKPVQTKTMKRIPTWGLRPNLPIGCKVTLRGGLAEKILNGLLKSRGNILPNSRFDNLGNFSFGIPEYIDIPDVEYDPDIGIIGLEVAVNLVRPGYRIKLRKIKKAKIPQRNRVTKEEAIDFIKEKFDTKIEEE